MIEATRVRSMIEIPFIETHSPKKSSIPLWLQDPDGQVWTSPVLVIQPLARQSVLCPKFIGAHCYGVVLNTDSEEEPPGLFQSHYDLDHFSEVMLYNESMVQSIQVVVVFYLSRCANPECPTHQAGNRS